MFDNRLMTKDKKKLAKKPAKKAVSPKKEPAKKVVAPKKEPAKKEAPKGKVKEKTKLKEDIVQEDDGIIVVEDDTGLDKEAELEARKAYLEEARSQEASDD
ncbi:MAG: hypothetical protein P4K92_05055 [Candidatus Nitrosotalea sp.]|nr:hypothetical protein [Candidatus Nitrosotalea sp.]